MNVIWLFPDSHPAVEDRPETGSTAHAFEEFQVRAADTVQKDGKLVQVPKIATCHADEALCGVSRHNSATGVGWVNPTIPKESHPRCPVCLERAKK